MTRNWQVPSPAGPPPAAGDSLLFTPGPRLGWVFRDRRELAVPFGEAQPNPQAIHAQAAGQAAAAERAWRFAWRWIGKPSIVVALFLLLLAGCSESGGGFNVGIALMAVVLCGPGLAFTCWQWTRRAQSRNMLPDQEYRQALTGWQARAAGHQDAELARLAGQPEWGSMMLPAPRTDVFGGTPAGWRALLAVHGASLLAERPLLVIDLAGQDSAGLLIAMAQRAGTETVTYRLPHDLSRCALLAELTPAQLADAVAEALHAGAPGAARVERAVDARVLKQLAGALAGRDVSVQRLATAVRVSLGYVVPDGVLSPAEREFLAGSLFPAGYQDQVAASLVRLDAVMSELASYAGPGWPTRPARLTCLAMDGGPHTATGEVLVALIAQWLTVQVTAASANPPAVIIAGADELARAHAERLAGACELRQVPVTLLFRHLRDDAVSMLGGGTTAFMRLGNHGEAEQAAGYLGRRHSFVVSSYTATQGGNQTSTYGGSEGYGDSDSRSTARTRGWQGSGFPGFHESSSGGRTRTSGTSTSRNWSTSWSGADGTNWSDAQAQQRVYEYAIEPTALQNLPEYALLLADRSGGSLTMRAVECDPAIITFPGASTGPLSAPGALVHGSELSYGSGPSAMYPAEPALAAPGQYQYPAEWQEPAAEELQPAWQPDEQPQEVPWWQRNQPPDLWR